MKKIAKLTVLPLLLALSAGYVSTATAAGNDCNAKRTAIENQIKEAQKYNNYHKVAGLKKALAETNTHCTDSGLIAKAQSKVTKLERKLVQKQDDVREVQSDLRQAQAKGDQKKVVKYQKKIQQKQANVQKIQAELQAARQELAALKG